MKCIRRMQLEQFEKYLRERERSRGTIEKYVRDVRAFAAWSAGREEITRETASEWKNHLLENGYQPVTVNSMVAALNSFFRFMGWEDCRISFLRVQKQNFRREERDMTKEDYLKLLETARLKGKDRLSLLMEAICSTGIRVSEVKYLTVEAAKEGKATVALKGKIRTILIPGKLSRKLLKYARKQKISAGEIFLTAKGKPLSRKQIWAEMKKLCADAGVEPTKVFPHNLRHLFAKTFYKVCRDLSRLADILGHSSVDTTRIYLTATENEQTKILNQLRLIS
ncbi:MAG: tyrosine-type recombinase/integrase [Emergencia sp.]